MDSFIVYTKHKKLIEKMPDADAGALIKAVFAYAETGEVSELPYGADMAFEVIRDVIDTNRDKWQSIKNERSEAGKKGMAKRWNKEDEEDNNVIFDDNKNNTVIKSDNKTYQTITNDNNAITKHNKTDFVNNKNNNVIFDDNKNNLSVSVSDSVSVNNNPPIVPPKGGQRAGAGASNNNNININNKNDANEGDVTLKEQKRDEATKKREVEKDNDRRFNDFWEAYPLKAGKKKAKIAWNKLKVTDKMLEEIMAGLNRYRASPQWQKDNGQYVPHPSTFLNQERWKDEIESSPSSSGNLKVKNKNDDHADFVDYELLALINMEGA